MDTENGTPPSFFFYFPIILPSGRQSLFGDWEGHLLPNCHLIQVAWIKLKKNIPHVKIPFHGGTDVQALAFCRGQGIEAPSGEQGVRLGLGWAELGTDASQQEAHSGRNHWARPKQEPKIPGASVLFMRNLWIVPFKHQHFLWLHCYFFLLCLCSPVLT